MDPFTMNIYLQSCQNFSWPINWTIPRSKTKSFWCSKAVGNQCLEKVVTACCNTLEIGVLNPKQLFFCDQLNCTVTEKQDFHKTRSSQPTPKKEMVCYLLNGSHCTFLQPHYLGNAYAKLCKWQLYGSWQGCFCWPLKMVELPWNCWT